MPYDPTIYLGSASHYRRGRPPYSAALRTVIADELGLDGHGRLLDVGCGPGILAVELSPLFDTVIGLDPDAAMLAEAVVNATESGATNATWIQARAEEIETLDLAPCRVVTFGQSFHWTDRDRVAKQVYDLLEPGGAIVLIAPDIDVGAPSEGTGDPPIPHEEAEALIDRYLGPTRRFGQGVRQLPEERYEAVLARSIFGAARTVHAPGRPDITRDIDGVVSGYLSMSWAAPHLFGDRLDDFVGELPPRCSPSAPPRDGSGTGPATLR